MADKKFPEVGDRVRVTGFKFQTEEGKVVELQEWIDMSDGGGACTGVVVLLDNGKEVVCDSLSGLHAEVIEPPPSN